MRRVLCWFSCGAASAYAAKLAIEKFSADACEVVYCDTSSTEHPDNVRFLLDAEHWLGLPIKKIRSEEYEDTWAVYEKTKFLHGPKGARCTIELKKVPRFSYQHPDDIHVFGYTAEEQERAHRLRRSSPELHVCFPLIEAKIQKRDCLLAIKEAGIELPAMYRLGYKNNNCIGCVKGGMGYWNRIRVDFPAVFSRMAILERKLNHTCIGGVFLDELPRFAGSMELEPDIECGILCGPYEPALDAEAAEEFRAIWGV